MYKVIGLTLLALAISMSIACPPTNPSANNPNNSLVAKPWPEVYGDNENTGFNFVHTQYALPPFIAWKTPVGPLMGSAPAIGPDGVIWITNALGEIVGINPDGTQHRRRKLDESIIASPVVNPVTNEIFAIGEHVVDESTGDFASHLYRLDAGAALLSVSSNPLRTGAAPKLWDHFVFVPAEGVLQVYDQESLQLVGFANAQPCYNLVCGDGGIPSTVLEVIGGIVACLATFTLSGTCPGTHFAPRPFIVPVLEPSVAIIDNPSVLPDGDVSKPIIVVASPFCAVGFRFHPDADAPPIVPPIDAHFELLWGHPLVPDLDSDCDAQPLQSYSPILAGGSAVVIASQNGRVLELDAVTGAELWERQMSEHLSCPPATNTLREIYVVEDTHLATLDSDGSLLSEVPLNGSGMCSAVSIDFTYAGTTQGLHTFDANGQQTFAPIQGSSPNIAATFIAIAEDGTLYVSSPSTDVSTDPNGLLVAYSTHASFAPQIVVPGVQWQAPADGATILSTIGQDLTVSLSAPGGAAFEGTVTFESDIDGTLCNGVVPANGSAACITAHPLTVGTHTLTAFATDTGGGTQSASTTVQVVAPPPAANTPPTVSITSPANSAIFKQAATISFSATVTDPDQAAFDPNAIQWQSSIDGALGAGLAFSKTLSLGQHTITATATDAAGAKGSASISVEVTQGPVVAITSPPEGSSHSDIEMITFTATVADVDEPSFAGDHVSWKSDISGDLGTGLMLQHKLAIGQHTITVTATDVNGFVGTALVHVHVVGN